MPQIVVLLHGTGSVSLLTEGLELLKSFQPSWELHAVSPQLDPAGLDRVLERLMPCAETRAVICVGKEPEVLATIVSARLLVPVLAVPEEGGGEQRAPWRWEIPFAFLPAGPHGFASAVMLSLQLIAGSDARLQQELQLWRLQLRQNFQQLAASLQGPRT